MKTLLIENNINTQYLSAQVLHTLVQEGRGLYRR